ncbi:hypothetical protein MMC22_011734 [Lobaria immixta]|nr:hypothetical protein [Lobaria immixta]
MATLTEEQLRAETVELLHQVARSISKHEEVLYSTIPPRCSWKTALKAVEDSLGTLDKEVAFSLQSRFGNSRILQQIALADARSSLSPLEAQSSLGLPIRTEVDIEKMGTPNKASENVRQKLANEAKSWPDLAFTFDPQHSPQHH